MIKTLKRLNKKELSFLFIAILLIVGQVYLDLKIPDYMSKITQLVQSDNSEMSNIISNGAMMLVCSLGSLVLAFIVGFFATYAGVSFEKNLRKQVFDKVQNFGMEEIKEFSTSSLITRNTNDITQIKMFLVMGAQMLARAPIMAIMAILKIVGKEWDFSLITIIGVTIVVILNLIIILVAIPKFKKIQKLIDRFNVITRENLTGIRVVRAYNAEDYQLNKFEKANDELTSTNMLTQKLMALMMPTMTLVMNLLSLAIYFVGASMINSASGMEKMTIFGDTVVFSSYAMQVIMAFIMLVVVFIIYPRASVSMNRVNEVLDKTSKIQYGNIDKDSNDLKGVVEFKNVSFKYQDAEDYILKDISFKANKGETIAIIGSTGSGKSTLINLIPRFYDVSAGEILIDGINIKEYQENYLNDKIGYISQKAILFKGSIKDNVGFGKVNNHKAQNEDIVIALDIAQASEFVSKMPNGIEADISQSGNNISGGQKQRLSIARAIARNPEIYIFDDSFSALDYRTDFVLRKELNKQTKEATKFIVAQRIGTIKDADKIIVLDEGKIVGIGKHTDLLNSCSVYKEIAKSQLSQKEIENAW